MSDKIKVAVGLSGGVDSTIAAYLLKKEGYEVIGLTMQTWGGGPAAGPAGAGSACYGPGEKEELENILQICRAWAIPHYTIPLAAEFRRQVLDYFCGEYLAGRTPTPCLICNRQIKFALLMERARAMGIAFDRFATGHYARVEYDETRGRFLLKRARDLAKDQSYFLAFLKQEQLRQVIFPLGAMRKAAVKALAAELGFQRLAEGRESQDFMEGGNYQALFQADAARPGPIIDSQDKVVGRHPGIIFYTIGQRKNLGISGKKEPFYVTAIDAAKNTIRVGPRSDLFCGGLLAGDLNWIAFDRLNDEMTVMAKIRRQHREAEALIAPRRPAEEPRARVRFAHPQMSITPGQAVVFYHGDIVLGGGIIRQAET